MSFLKNLIQSSVDDAIEESLEYYLNKEFEKSLNMYLKKMVEVIDKEQEDISILSKNTIEEIKKESVKLENINQLAETIEKLENQIYFLHKEIQKKDGIITRKSIKIAEYERGKNGRN